VSKARTVHVDANFPAHAGPGLSFSATLVHGAGVSATFDLHGKKLDIVKQGDELYVKGYSRPIAAALGIARRAGLARRWIEVHLPNPLVGRVDLGAATHLSELVSLPFASMKAPRITGNEVVGGIRAEAVQSAGEAVTVYIERAAPHYPVAVDGDGVAFTYSRWGRPAHIAAPHDALPLARLQARSAGHAARLPV